EGDELMRAHGETFALAPFVAGEACVEDVRAGWNRRKVVLTNIVRDNLARNVRPFVRERHGGARNPSVGVADRATNAARKLLRVNRCRAEHAQQEKAERGNDAARHTSRHDEIPPRIGRYPRLNPQRMFTKTTERS